MYKNINNKQIGVQKIEYKIVRKSYQCLMNINLDKIAYKLKNNNHIKLLKISRSNRVLCKINSLNKNNKLKYINKNNRLKYKEFKISLNLALKKYKWYKHGLSLI